MHSPAIPQGKKFHLWSYPSAFTPLSLSLGKRTRSVSFETVEFLRIQRPMLLSSPALYFPSVTHLVMEEGQLLDGTSPMTVFPKLMSLKYVGNLTGAIHEQGIPNSELTSLHLRENNTVTNWNSISLRKMETLKLLKLNFLTQFSIASYESLTGMDLDCPELTKFGVLNTPQLDTLTIKTSSPLSFHTINAPKLKTLYIEAPAIEEMHSIHTPYLSTVEFDIRQTPNPGLDFSWFHNVKDLSLRELCDVLLHTKSLKKLHVQKGDEPQQGGKLFDLI